MIGALIIGGAAVSAAGSIIGGVQANNRSRQQARLQRSQADLSYDQSLSQINAERENLTAQTGDINRRFGDLQEQLGLKRQSLGESLGQAMGVNAAQQGASGVVLTGAGVAADRQAGLQMNEFAMAENQGADERDSNLAAVTRREGVLDQYTAEGGFLDRSRNLAYRGADMTRDAGRQALGNGIMGGVGSLLGGFGGAAGAAGNMGMSLSDRNFWFGLN